MFGIGMPEMLVVCLVFLLVVRNRLPPLAPPLAQILGDELADFRRARKGHNFSKPREPLHPMNAKILRVLIVLAATAAFAILAALAVRKYRQITFYPGTTVALLSPTASSLRSPASFPVV